MSGVPLLQALADHYNKTGTAATAMTTKIAKGTKVSAEEMTHLKNNLSEYQSQLKILEEQHVKAGAATDKHNLAIMKVKNSISELNTKMAGANKLVSTGGGKKNLTAMDVKDMIEKNGVSAKDVDAVLAEMTGKGGKFFDMMGKQSKTFSGVVSNIKDDMTRLALSIMGFDSGGNLKDGSIFDRLTKGAQAFLSFVDAHQNQIVAFGQTAMNKLGQMADWVLHTFIPGLVNLYQWVDKNRWILAIVAGVLAGALVLAIVGVVTAIGGFIASIGAVIASIAAFVTSAVGIASIITGVVVGAIVLAMQNWNQFRDTVFAVGNDIKAMAIDIANSVINMVNDIINAINTVIKGATSLANKVPGIKISAPQIPTLPTISAGSSLGGGASYGAPATANYSRNVSITNNNNFSSNADAQAFATYQAWQINGR